MQSSSQAPGAGFAVLAGCCARGAMHWLGTSPGAHRGRVERERLLGQMCWRLENFIKKKDTKQPFGQAFGSFDAVKH
jgi:hypothetical protein